MPENDFTNNTNKPEGIDDTPSGRENLSEKLDSLLADDNSGKKPALPVTQQLTVLALLLLVIFGSGIVTTVVAYLNKDDTTQTATIPDTTRSFDYEEQTSAVDEVDVVAESAFVWDMNEQRVLFEKNPDTQMPLASLTKLMTALVAHEIIADNETVAIPKDAIEQDGESGFYDGESFSFDDLMDLTLISSSNDGAFAMAAAAGALLNISRPTETFVQAMNIRADELGLSQTYFRNPTGLDLSESEAGAYGSARDMAFLVEYILKHYPNILEYTVKSETVVSNSSGLTHEVANTNQTVDTIPGMIGSKTGYTTLAGGNLAIAFDASLNRPIIVVALGSTYNGRFSDVLELSEMARSQINDQ